MKKIWKNLAVAAVIIFLLFQLACLVYPMKYEECVAESAELNGISQSLVYAVIKAESNFSPNAVSDSGAFGLMQLMPETAKWICEKEQVPFETKYLTEPEANIRIGCMYLSYLLLQYNGNETNAVAAYNAGHARVDAWLADSAYSPDGQTLKNIPFPETDQYVSRVKKYKKIYENLYGENMS